MNLDPELEIYLRDAWRYNEEHYEEPAYGQPFRSPLFLFVRAVRAHPSLGRLPALTAAEAVEQYLAHWGDGNGDPWQAAFPKSDDPRTEFVDTWEKIKWPHAEVERALQAVKTLPLRPKRSYSPKYAEFVSVAGHLQRNIEGPILLPCRKFAEALGCEPMTISRYRTLATKDGIIRMERRGRKHHREADEFSFNLERFDWKTGNEIDSENLGICVTPKSEGECYTDSQEIKEIERKKESQETKDTKDNERYTRVHSNKAKPSRSEAGPYIPTTAELAEELQRTKDLRGFQDFNTVEKC